MSKIRIMALGGLDEDGKNMYLVEIADNIFVVDAGLKYPSESEQLGIEYIVPDFKYLIENKDRVKGVFISHGHDDVMGGLAHLVSVLDCDIYATALSCKVIEDSFAKHKIKNKHLHVIQRQDTIKIGNQIIHSFPVMQSIPDGVGFSFETPYGQIVYTSEFIFDYDFVNSGFAMDVNTFSQMGKDKVLVLMSESLGAYREGYTSPKHKISGQIEHYFELNEKRIVITLYKQNLFRIIEVLELANKYHKKVYFYDRYSIKLLQRADELGYYKIPKGILISDKEFSNDLKDVVVVVSESGNKVFKLMNNIIIGEVSKIKLSQEDIVIIASPVVAGTEKDATAMENDLYKAGVQIVKLKASQVLSMHASQEDLKMMLYLTKPRYYLPIKGQYSALINNADLAVEIGYTPDRIIVLDNGQFAQFENGKLVSTSEMIELKDTAIDSSDNTDISGMVLKDRQALSTDGVIIAGIVLDFKTKKVIGGPDVQSRGVIYLKDAEHILNEIGNILIETINEDVANNSYDNIQTRTEAKEKISRFVLKETGKKPMILPAIVEINMGLKNETKG